jgi:uncharacterized membrane-anchored protein
MYNDRLVNPDYVPFGGKLAMKAHSRYVQTAVVCLFMLSISINGRAQQPTANQTLQKINSLAWLNGPGVGSIGGVAQIRLQKDLRFLDSKNSNEFLKITGNLPEDDNYIIAPRVLDWWATFYFDDVGYVRDDETIDANQLLKTLQSGDEPQNEQRQKLGLEPIYTLGWITPPHYDTTTKSLEWGIKLTNDKTKTSDDDVTVNYSIRILGRAGVMKVILVTDPVDVAKDRRSLLAALDGFNFIEGQKYTEFRSGDKVAAYGLGALVVGGAAAVAAKSAGGFVKLLKFIGIAIFAGGAALMGLVKRLFTPRSKKSDA